MVLGYTEYTILTLIHVTCFHQKYVGKCDTSRELRCAKKHLNM